MNAICEKMQRHFQPLPGTFSRPDVETLHIWSTVAMTTVYVAHRSRWETWRISTNGILYNVHGQGTQIPLKRDWRDRHNMRTSPQRLQQYYIKFIHMEMKDYVV